MALVGQRRGLFIVIVLLLKSVFSLLSNIIFICCSIDVHNWRHGGFKASALASESSGLGSRLNPQCTNHIRWSTFLFFASVSEQCPSEKRLTNYLLCHPMLFHPLFLCLNFSRVFSVLRSVRYLPTEQTVRLMQLQSPTKLLAHPAISVRESISSSPSPSSMLFIVLKLSLLVFAKLFWCTITINTIVN